MKPFLFTAIGAALLLAACVQEPMTYRDLDRLSAQAQREAISRPPPDTCHMAEHQNLVGTSGDQIDPATLPAGARVLCHDCAATLDYNSTRLNVVLGADGKVASLRCG